MTRSLCLVTFVLLLSRKVQLQRPEDTPCPDVLSYEARSDQPDRWYGVITLRSREELHGVWINVQLDRKADLLGNWFGEATSKNNQEFVIKNREYNLEPGPPVAVRFFIKYDVDKPIPLVKKIRLNGRTICGDDTTPISSSSSSSSSSSDYATLHISQPSNSANGVSPNENSRVEERPVNRPSDQNYRPVDQNNRPIEQNGMRVEQNNRPGNQNRQNGQGERRGSGGNRPANQEDEIRATNVRPSGSSARPSSSSSNSRPAETDSRRTSGSQRPSTNNQATDYERVTSVNPRPTTSNNFDDEYFSGDFNPSRPVVVASLTEKPDANACGITTQEPRPLITYGHETLAGQWPWHTAVYLSKGTDLKYICGGSLISRRHVLTAAHCVTKLKTEIPVNSELLQVYLGKYSLKKLNPGVQTMTIARVYVHPDYNSTVFHNDLAILKLSQTATVTDYVRPVCLWEEDTSLNYIVEKLGTVVGWGFDENGVLTENIMKAHMPVVSTENCIFSNREFFSRFTSNTTFCAGFRNGTSACTGDSGGGMFFPKSNSERKIWQIRGVVSLSAALQSEKVVCDTSNYIVFTDAAKHLGWIKSVIQSR